MLVLDTHAALWWSFEPKRLGKAARAAIDGADSLGVPAVTFWEAAVLVRRQHYEMDQPVASWLQQLLAIPRLEALPLTAEIAVAADGLSMHPDPADRFIVATALAHGAALVTKDKLIRRLAFVDTVW